MITELTAIDSLAYRTIGCAIRVHKAFGPGVLEMPYILAMCEELTADAIPFRRNVAVSLSYRGKPLGMGYRLDLLIDDTIIVEAKSVKQVTDVHKKQLLSYLKLTRRPLGLLINFNVPVLQQGITRLINLPLAGARPQATIADSGDSMADEKETQSFAEEELL